MPKLNKDILLEILERIIKVNANESDKLQMEIFKFGLAGRENLSALMEFLEKATECNIDRDCYIAKIRRSTLMIGPSTSVYLPSLMKKIGQNIKTLTIQDEPENTKPIIDAICEAKKLQILDLEDSTGIAAFQRITKECSKSLKKITVCVNTDIPEIGDIDGLDLDELLIETDLNNNFNTFLNHKCCRTKSLIFDLYQFLPTSSFSWGYLIQSFSGIKNPVLESVKEFKLLLEIDEYAEDLQLKEFIENVGETFPKLEWLNIEKQIPTKLYYNSRPLDFYNELYSQFIAASHQFQAKIFWAISQTCQSTSLQAIKKSIISQSPKFTVTKEDENQISFLCCETINNLKELSFKILLYSNDSHLNENALFAEMNAFDAMDF